MKGRVRLTMAIVFCLAAGGPLSGQSKNKKNDPEQIGNRDVGKGINFYSLEREIALGKGMAQEIERQARIVVSPVPAEFVNRVAHAAARHGTRQASRGQVINFASLPLIFLGGWAGYAIRQGAGLAVPVAFLKFSRGFEREADLLGVQYVYKAGYDPTAFIDFFERLEAMEKKQPGTASELFRSHPTIASRIEFTQRNIEELLKAQPQYLITTSEFQEVKQAPAGRRPGTRRRRRRTRMSARR
jgi:predicted Zn-dependent protease